MRLRFFTVLCLIFVVSFWWAGDASRVIQSRLDRFLAVKSDEPTLTQRIIRIAALKTAVSSRLPKQHYIHIDSIPLSLQQAVIAVEDNRFYKHVGIDISAIFRASLVNLQSGEVVEGASTITQQLVKNLFLSPERTLARKLEEVVLALDIELRYSKPEILEMYLNTIYFGENAYGVGRAAAVYFNKTPDKLNLSEAALLAGLPNAPALYSPFTDFDAAKRRQSIVISAMQRHGYIDTATAQMARTAPLSLNRYRQRQ